MKKVTLLFAFLLSLQQVSALACTDLSDNLFRTDENNNVKALQDFLYEKGYLKATPNGYFGPGTFAAVKEYQTAKGINPTGVVGPLTRESLKTATCTASSSPTSSLAKTSTSTPATLPKTETATPSSKTTTSLPTKIVCTTLTEGLGVGSESPAVLSLQEYLYLKGYLKAAPNGYFGPGTYAAVTAFQKENGIAQTGTVGPLTREKLKASSCGITATTPPAKPITETTKPVAVATTTPVAVKAASPPAVVTKPVVPVVSSKNEQRFKDAETILTLVRAAYQRWVPLIGREPLPMRVDYQRALTEHQIDLLRIDGEAAGVIETMMKDDHLWIENIAVAPTHQGKGYGQRLLHHAEDLAKAAGKLEIKLLTNGAFDANITLYQKHGYIITSTEPFMGGTTVYMTKTIVGHWV